MMIFNLKGVPDDLEPGDYATKVEAARWKGNDLVIDLQFNGPLANKFDCLFPIKRHRLTKGSTLLSGEEVTE